MEQLGRRIGEKQRPPAQAPTTVSLLRRALRRSRAARLSWARNLRDRRLLFPFRNSFVKHLSLSAEGAPEELWNSRERCCLLAGADSDGRLLAGTGNSGALLAIDGRAFRAARQAGSRRSPGLHAIPRANSFFATANPEKVFSVGPEYERRAPTSRAHFDAQLFSQWDAWIGGVLHLRLLKNWRQSHHRDRMRRVSNFLCAPATRGPGQRMVSLVRAVCETRHNAECPPARFVQWKAVIHDGRSGDGVSWVSLAYLPRNVAPIIDGIAVQDSGVRAQANVIIQSGQQVSVNLRQPQSSNPIGVVVTQSSSPVRFEQPPQGFRDKGYQSVLWNARDENDDELRFSVYFRGRKRNGLEAFEGKTRTEVYSWTAPRCPTAPIT